MAFLEYYGIETDPSAQPAYAGSAEDSLRKKGYGRAACFSHKIVEMLGVFGKTLADYVLRIFIAFEVSESFSRFGIGLILFPSF